MSSISATLDEQLKTLKELEAKLDRLEPALCSRAQVDTSKAVLNTGRSINEGHAALSASLSKLEQGLDSLEALASSLGKSYGVTLPSFGHKAGGGRSLIAQLSDLLKRAEDPRLEDRLRQLSGSSSSSSSSSSAGTDQQRWRNLLQKQEEQLKRLDQLEAQLNGIFTAFLC